MSFKFIIFIFFLQTFFSKSFEEFYSSKNNGDNDVPGQQNFNAVFEAINKLDDILPTSQKKWSPDAPVGSIYYLLKYIKNDPKDFKKFVEAAKESQDLTKFFLGKFAHNTGVAKDKFYKTKNGELDYEKINKLIVIIFTPNGGEGESSFLKILRQKDPENRIPQINYEIVCQPYFNGYKEYKESLKNKVEENFDIFGNDIIYLVRLYEKEIKETIKDISKIENETFYKTAENSEKYLNFNDLFNYTYLIRVIYSCSTLSSNFELKINDEEREKLFLLLNILTGGIYKKNEIMQYADAFEKFLKEKKYPYSVFGSNAGDSRNFFKDFNNFLDKNKIEKLRLFIPSLHYIDNIIKKMSRGLYSDFNKIAVNLNSHMLGLAEDRISAKRN